MIILSPTFHCAIGWWSKDSHQCLYSASAWRSPQLEGQQRKWVSCITQNPGVYETRVLEKKKQKNIKDKKGCSPQNQIKCLKFCPFFVDFVVTVMRQRHWINTETAISSLKQRDRPLKSKYLKDAYELRTQAVADQGRSETMMGSNGHTKRIGNRDTGIDSDLRDSTNSETLCVACHDGGCLRNSV